MAADIAVVGAGITGLATAYALSERGASVVVYERGVPGNAQSGGESRIFRHAHDDPRLIAFACEARSVWREWEDRFDRELLSRDGVVSIGPAAPRRLQLLEEVGGVRVGTLDRDELALRLPVLAPFDGPAMLDLDGGAIRTRAAIECLTTALGDRLRLDEVLSVRPHHNRVELRAGGGVAAYDCVVVCAGRGTAALARGVGLELPVRHSAQVRLAYRVRGEPPGELACLLDSGRTFAEESAYADPYPGNGAYALGLGHTPAAPDGAVLDPGELAGATESNRAYVARALPGLEPEPFEARHCWITTLPWSADAFAVWEAGAVLFLAGDRMFKHAPLIGRMLAEAALAGELPAILRPAAKLGATPEGQPHPVGESALRAG
jgi:sarcosine oxidase